MAVSLRDYFIRFLYKTDKQGAKEVENTTEKLAKGFDKAGARAFAFNEKIEMIKKVLEPFRQFKELVNGVAEDADNLLDLSERTGIATKRLEELGYMAKLSGTSLDTMTTGLRILEKNMGGAINGSKEQGEAFAKLGIKLHGANGKLKTADELLPEISKSFEKLPSHAQKTAAAMELFGRSGQELLPFLERGPESIREMQKELEQLGGTSSKEFLQLSSDYVDSMEKVAMIMKGFKQAFLGPIIKMFLDSNNQMVKFVKASGAIIRVKLAEWGQQVVTSFQALKKLFIDFAGPLIALAAAFNAPLLAMIGVRAMLGLLIDDFANWRAGNDSLIGRMIENWDTWMSKVEKSHPILAGFLKMAKSGLKGVYSVFMLIENVFNSIMEGKGMKEIQDIMRTAKRYWGIGSSGVGHDEGISVPDPTIRKNPITGMMEADTGAAEAFNRGGVAGVESMRQQTANVQAPVTINATAPPGTDPRAFAAMIGDAIQEHFGSNVRGAFMSLIPEKF